MTTSLGESNKDDRFYSSKYGRIEILTSESYPQFRQSCMIALISANAWSIVQGTEPRPEPANQRAQNQTMADWEERRRTAFKIICSSISGEILDKVAHLLEQEDVYNIWKELKKEDRAANPVYRKDQLEDFWKVKWDPQKETLQALVNRLQSYRKKLLGHKEAPSEENVLTRLYQCIPPDDYWQQGKKLAIYQNSDLYEAISLLQTYEKPSQSTETPTPTAAVTDHKGDNRGGSRGRGGWRGRGNGRGKGRWHGNQDDRKTKWKNKRLERNQCKFCLKKGHFESDCIQWQRAQKALLDKNKGRGKKEDDSDREEHARVVAESRIVELYHNSNAESDPDDEYLDSIDTSDSSEYATATACAINPESRWAVDSGATKHFSSYLQDFDSIKRWSTPRIVRLANGTGVEALGYGHITIITTCKIIRLTDAWYAPDLSCRLISVGELNDKGVSVLLEDRKFTATLGDTVLFKGTSQNGLYYVDQPSESAFTTGTGMEVDGQPAVALADKRKLWHDRMGHSSYKYIDKLLECADGVEFRKIRPADQPAGETACEACLAGKMKESFNKTTDNRQQVKVRRLHADISGIKVKSIRGFRYFLLITDDATRQIWTMLLRDKSAPEVVPKFKELLQTIELESDCKCVFVRSDNGKGEFGAMFQDLLTQKGIQFEPSPSYEHALNGVIERAMGKVNAKILSTLFHSKLPNIFWDYAVEHAVWLLNRLPTTALPYGEYSEAMTPFQAYFGRRPDLREVRVFGCEAYQINRDRQKTTVDPKILKDKLIFVGMKGNRVWRLFNLDTQKEILTTNAGFHEYTFPKFTITNGSGRLPAPQRTLTELRNTSAEAATRPSTQDEVERHTGLKETRHTVRTRSGNEDETLPSRTRSGNEDETLPSRARPGNEDETLPPTTDSRNGPRLSGSRTGRLSSTVTGAEIGPGMADSMVNRPAEDPVVDPVFKPTRSGRVPKKTVFSDSVIQLVRAMKAVHIEGESSSIEVPAPPFEAVTVEDAMKEDAPEWKKAIMAELQSLKETNTYRVVESPKGRKVISSRWVLRRKFDHLGHLARRKARLVIKGFEQKYGIDYFSTFASVIRYSTLRILLAKAAVEDLEIEQMDVDTAFLNPTLKEEIYMEIPDFFELLYPDVNFKGKCLRLRKSLYGLKQAPREWLLEVQNFFASIGFTSSSADPNLFIRNNTYILLYVDDMLIIGDKASVATAKAEIGARWKCKDLREAKLFVGFQIERDRAAKSLRIHQTLYTTKLLERFGLQRANPVSQPFPTGTVLIQSNLADVEEEKGNTEYQRLKMEEAEAYRQAVGSLLYLSNCTRFDISYAVGQLARFMHAPRTVHFRLAKQVLRYLCGTATAGILYSANPSTSNSNLLTSKSNLYKHYSDATWGTESDRVSFQGWYTSRAGGAVLWSAKRQNSVALSSMEAEYMSASEAAKEVAWLEKLSSDLKEESSEPPILFCDNAGAIDLIHNQKFHNKAKHIDIRYHHIRDDMVGKGRLKVVHIPGVEQPADVLTKQLPATTARKHIYNMGLRIRRSAGETV
jgi:Reverse transcriptase (RNA-dependent DNA polymerase)/GAG-pre-integrase domain